MTHTVLFCDACIHDACFYNACFQGAIVMIIATLIELLLRWLKLGALCNNPRHVLAYSAPPHHIQHIQHIQPPHYQPWKIRRSVTIQLQSESFSSGCLLLTPPLILTGNTSHNPTTRKMIFQHPSSVHAYFGSDVFGPRHMMQK